MRHCEFFSIEGSLLETLFIYDVSNCSVPKFEISGVSETMLLLYYCEHGLDLYFHFHWLLLLVAELKEHLL